MSKNNVKKFLVRLKKSKASLELAKLAVITFATWINPEAVLLIAVLEFCFLVLEFIQSDKDQ